MMDTNQAGSIEVSSWKSFLKADPTNWLLEEDNPSVAYLTRVHLLGEPVTSKKAAKERSAIMSTGVVPSILSKQVDGRWNAPGRHYLDKYTGTVWQLMILAEHHADGTDPRIQEACKYILDCAQDRESGGFSVNSAAKGEGGRHSEVIPCLTGNMVWSLVRLGFLEDARVRGGIDWITTYQRFDDGIPKPVTGWPYDRYEMCWGKHTCHMGPAKALKALAEIPTDKRSNEITQTIARGAEYFLAHHVFKMSHDLTKVAKPGWLKFQFPLMYQTDVLEVTRILLDLGSKDDRLQEPVDFVLSKQNTEGKWDLEATFNGKFQVDLESRGKPSKWITLNSLRVLRSYFGE